MRYRGLLATVFLGTALMSVTVAQAGYVATLEQVGSNVVASGNGAFDLTGLTFMGPGVGSPAVSASGDTIGLGAAGANVAYFGGFFGPSNFGSGLPVLASSGSGSFVAIIGGGDLLFLPTGYVSGTSISDTATFDNTTLGGLGVNLGTYEWTWGAGADQNFTLIVGPVAPSPEPASLALLGAGLAGIGAIRRRKR
jgi:hypothetical protein